MTTAVTHVPTAPVGRRIRPDNLLHAIWLGAVLVAAWPLLLALRGPQPPALPVLVAHVCGMLAGYGVVVLIGLMSRAPALEHGVGSDRLSRWHSTGGRAVVALVVLHAWGAVVAWARSRRETTWIAVWHVLRLPSLIAATVGTAL